MHFLFLLLHIIIFHGAIIVYIVLQDSLHYQLDVQVYNPLWGSPGLLLKGIRQFEVINPMNILPSGEEIF